jgi:hypothetical protein
MRTFNELESNQIVRGSQTKWGHRPIALLGHEKLLIGMENQFRLTTLYSHVSMQ